jgi:pyruvate dehydrogenase E2 component (dihydrolipoamide acetyltransferase)
MAEAKPTLQVVMPKLGLTMTEATLVEWLKAEGDQVEKGEPLFVLESDKSMLEIESPASGVLHILVPAGDTIPVHTPIAALEGAEDLAPSSPAADAEPVTPAKPAGSARPGLARDRKTQIPASPKARVLARQLGVSLEDLPGTGPRGMVVASDVNQAAQAAPAVQASPVARNIAEEAGLDLTGVPGTGPRGRIMRQDVEGALGQQDLQQAPDTVAAPVGPEALSGLRAIIAQRLTASWRERPHVTVTTEADATNLVAARQQATAELERKVSYDALLVALVARALREHPAVNVRLTGTGLEQLSEINIGVAVDTERGLLVPVVRDAAAKDLAQIQHILQELVERTLSGKSLPDDLVGGTFTITNLGMFEIDAFTPIINPPESAILGVGRIVNKPVGLEGQIVLRDMMTLSLSFDHRLIDGAPAARFLQRIKQLVERPFALAL